MSPEVGRSSSPDGPDVRRLAVGILSDMERGHRFADALLRDALSRVSLEPRDRHLLQEVVYGTIRHRNTLDHILKLFTPSRRIDRAARLILRSAAYQMIYLDRIPHRAAIHDAVAIAKEISGERLGGFVNAVLRALAREIESKGDRVPPAPRDPNAIPIRSGFCRFRRPVVPPYEEDPVLHLAIRHSHPEWLVRRWHRRFGEAAAILLCDGNNRTPDLHLRATHLAPDGPHLIRALAEEGIDAEPTGHPLVIRARNADDPTRLHAFRRGAFIVQDISAARVVDLASPPRGSTVLDLCASPGGKTVAIAEAVGPEGRVVACDVSEEKIRRILENIERVRIGNVEPRLVPGDPGAIDLGERFPWILVDAPCSNTGVLARRPEARWRVNRNRIGELARLQQGLLQTARRHLAPGGTIVYATCSIEPEENQHLARAFLAAEPGMKRTGVLSLLPHRDHCDGVFAFAARHQGEGRSRAIREGPP